MATKVYKVWDVRQNAYWIPEYKTLEQALKAKREEHKIMRNRAPLQIWEIREIVTGTKVKLITKKVHA